MSLTFNDRVVIITGAGGGLGREYALDYAKRGAKVVVNDLGGTLGGSGHDTRAADKVVEEIRKAGGTAVANYDTVTDGDKIVKTAIDAFGRVDVIVNNAGILRDGSFAKMTEKNFSAVVDVHLNGSYKLCKAAWPYMRQQKYGRIVNTASPAGLYGNFGQTNYSAAKLGLVGLSETLAKEGHKYNIKVNVIAPIARSRMTEGLLPDHVIRVMGPEKVVPMVVYLTHENTEVTNSIFEPGAGYYTQVRWERSSGGLFNPDEKTFTPEAILHKFPEVLDFKDKPFKAVEHPYQLADYNDLISKARQLPPNEQGSVQVKSLKDKVVIITGAGAGLGRSHALWFAKYGARVVVNDLKGADGVVAEINSQYGEGRAVADSHNIVTDAAAVVETAMKAFERVDVLVNNAGILRDRSFVKMTDDEWNSVLQVHLLSVFALSKAVWPIFMQQRSGVIVNTTSTSGIYGNFGQANYSAAKAAVLGFSKSLAIEGAKRGIRVYVIAPHAFTNMTKTIFGETEIKSSFEPSQVSPFVVLLASNEFARKYRRSVGSLFEVGGGWIGHTRWQRAKGAVSLELATAEFIRDNWATITDFSKPSYPASIDAAGNDMMKAIMTATALQSSTGALKYTSRDSIIYNLGLGANTTELKYVYENHPAFQVLSTYPIVLAMNAGFVDFPSFADNFDYNMLLHGEQYMKLNQYPVPTEGSVKVETAPVASTNKGKKAALIVIGYKVIDAKTNKQLAYTEGSYFVRGAQVPESKKVLTERPTFSTTSFSSPDREPDFEAEIDTSVHQAALYRLAGDYNPLHIDPKVSSIARFPKPILHGLCSLGCTAKALFEKFGQYDELKTRFSSFVFPGDKLKVRAWKEDGGIVIFETIDLDRDMPVLTNSAIKLVGSQSKL
ncbi:AGL060Wp [Eremothecium gossypii ATCC 10895]|uniref:Peroxisomal hydratase-dehydrogenase-epimerase n=1 Tax=Eremothecium gossypii (strain ATCC 10895 / CBS 109.51 / FGSC 9923 / NRRL Y-1056) TaxID=284811 RepID=Q750L7_EREGS|nr:AGL060Wp [Eremothecium gossypii ATCC 10895]AAS54430.1 AGL060Wp [Eremothecium gossypii ATCC 10895]AEY98762.1 FAGL060Wp [Eremothecium gossypii FDAG1]